MRFRMLVALFATALTACGASTPAPTRRSVILPTGWKAPPGYSHAVATRGGRLLVISGQVPLDPSGALVGGSDFKAQARQAFANLGTVLAASGLSYRDVVKLTFFVVGLDHDRLVVLREARDEVLPAGDPPASSLLGVQALFRPDVMIEVEALAELPPER